MTCGGSTAGQTGRDGQTLTWSLFRLLPFPENSSSSSPEPPDAEAPDAEVADVCRRLVCSVSLRPSLMSWDRVCCSDGGDLEGDPDTTPDELDEPANGDARG